MVLRREGSVCTYREIGIPDPHHPLTHYRNNPEWVEKMTKIDTFHAELLEGDAAARKHGSASQQNSAPSDLKISAMRLCVATNYDYPLIKVYINQGLYGLGEVRDAAGKISPYC
jgi:hypothetical protein